MLLEEVKLYLRVYDDSDDLEINSFIIAAENYLKNSGINTEILVENELYKLTIKMLVSHWYDNRGIETSNNMNEISLSLK
ncbi:MAG: head-tail connector protein, partial [Cetobacterium sp.]